MRKIIEWKRRNADNTIERQYIDADMYWIDSAIVDGVTWNRVYDRESYGYFWVEAE